MTVDVRETIAAVLGVWNGADPAGLEGLLAPSYRGHMLGVPGGERDGAAYADVIDRFRAANPGVAFRLIEQFSTSDRLVSRLEGRRPGADAGASSVSEGINIARFDDQGLLAEEWAIWSAWREQLTQESPGS